MMFGYAKQTQVDALKGILTLLSERVEALENPNVGGPTAAGSPSQRGEFGGVWLGSRAWRAIRAAAEAQSLMDVEVKPDSAAILEKRVEKNNA